MAKTYKKRRAVRKGKKQAPRRARVPRAPRRGAVAEWASLTENKPSTLLNANQMYQTYNLALSQFARASAVAKGYQLFRIKRVTIKLSPLADTFIAGSGQQVPYLYYMIDRTKNLSAANTQTTLKRCGAIPRRFDEKIISFSYTPSVLQSSLDTSPPPGQATGQFVAYKMSPWLNTRDSETLGVWNPDSTDHQGIVWYVENNGSTAIEYKCEMIVEFQFKKPSFEVVPSTEHPEPVEVTLLEGV